MYTSANYNTINPNSSNQIRSINDLVSVNSITGRKSNAKKYRTKQSVHGNNGNATLKDNFSGAF